MRLLSLFAVAMAGLIAVPALAQSPVRSRIFTGRCRGKRLLRLNRLGSQKSERPFQSRLRCD